VVNLGGAHDGAAGGLFEKKSAVLVEKRRGNIEKSTNPSEIVPRGAVLRFISWGAL
jgi:hypothetical protein